MFKKTTTTLLAVTLLAFGATACGGDDDTDEDAFLAIQSAGFGIRVGDPVVPTAARGFLHDIPSVRAFLQTWSAIPPVDKENMSWTRDG